MKKLIIPFQPVSRDLLWLNVLVAAGYFSWWIKPANVGNPWLYYVLFIGELYHLTMSLSFWFTIWPVKMGRRAKFKQRYQPSVDIFIPVAGEPADIVRNTVQAAQAMPYRQKKIYILNDGLVAHKDNYREIELLAMELGVHCLTRTKAGGDKAGNINDALKRTRSELIALFDADMAPHTDFLQRTIPYFRQPITGFVQTPQYYRNQADNLVTQGAWDQQKLFFGPILRGKQTGNGAFICGTNVVMRRMALEQVGGMVEDNIAEDFLTSLLIHQRGWVSYYVPQVLAEGLAPQDLPAYTKQQFRWARGSLEVLFGHNPFFSRHLTWAQKIEYLSSALYYLNGLVIAIDITMPLIYLFTGQQPVVVSTTSFAVYFLPFMFLNLYTLNVVSGKEVSFKTFSFTYASWWLQLMALWAVLTRQKSGFSVTPKQKQSGLHISYIMPHITYCLLAVLGIAVTLEREPFNSSVATNIAWVLFNITLFLPYMATAFQSSRWFQPAWPLAWEN